MNTLPLPERNKPRRAGRGHGSVAPSISDISSVTNTSGITGISDGLTIMDSDVTSEAESRKPRQSFYQKTKNSLKRVFSGFKRKKSKNVPEETERNWDELPPTDEDRTRFPSPNQSFNAPSVADKEERNFPKYFEEPDKISQASVVRIIPKLEGQLNAKFPDGSEGSIPDLQDIADISDNDEFMMAKQQMSYYTVPGDMMNNTKPASPNPDGQLTSPSQEIENKSRGRSRARSVFYPLNHKLLNMDYRTHILNVQVRYKGQSLSPIQKDWLGQQVTGLVNILLDNPGIPKNLPFIDEPLDAYSLPGSTLSDFHDSVANYEAPDRKNTNNLQKNLDKNMNASRNHLVTPKNFNSSSSENSFNSVGENFQETKLLPHPASRTKSHVVVLCEETVIESPTDGVNLPDVQRNFPHDAVDKKHRYNQEHPKVDGSNTKNFASSSPMSHMHDSTERVIERKEENTETLSEELRTKMNVAETSICESNSELPKKIAVQINEPKSSKNELVASPGKKTSSKIAMQIQKFEERSWKNFDDKSPRSEISSTSYIRPFNFEMSSNPELQKPLDNGETSSGVSPKRWSLPSQRRELSQQVFIGKRQLRSKSVVNESSTSGVQDQANMSEKYEETTESQESKRLRAPVVTTKLSSEILQDSAKASEERGFSYMGAQTQRVDFSTANSNLPQNHTVSDSLLADDCSVSDFSPSESSNDCISATSLSSGSLLTDTLSVDGAHSYLQHQGQILGLVSGSRFPANHVRVEGKDRSPSSRQLTQNSPGFRVNSSSPRNSQQLTSGSSGETSSTLICGQKRYAPAEASNSHHDHDKRTRYRSPPPWKNSDTSLSTPKSVQKQLASRRKPTVRFNDVPSIISPAGYRFEESEMMLPDESLVDEASCSHHSSSEDGYFRSMAGNDKMPNFMHYEEYKLARTGISSHSVLPQSQLHKYGNSSPQHQSHMAPVISENHRQWCLAPFQSPSHISAQGCYFPPMMTIHGNQSFVIGPRPTGQLDLVPATASDGAIDAVSRPKPIEAPSTTGNSTELLPKDALGPRSVPCPDVGSKNTSEKFVNKPRKWRQCVREKDVDVDKVDTWWMPEDWAKERGIGNYSQGVTEIEKKEHELQIAKDANIEQIRMSKFVSL